MASSVTDAQCFADSSGAIEVVMASGASPYTFTWAGLPSESEASVSDLIAAAYAVTVTDSAGCQDSAVFSIGQPDELVVSAGQGVPPGPGTACNGSAEAEVTGGTPPYSYVWSDPDNQTSAEAIDLCDQAIVQVTVTDDNGCTGISDSLLILFPGGFDDPLAGSLTVYPIPAAHTVRIASSAHEIRELVVTDLSGKVIMRHRDPAGTRALDLDVSSVPSGSYFLSVHTSGGVISQSLLIGR